MSVFSRQARFRGAQNTKTLERDAMEQDQNPNRRRRGRSAVVLLVVAGLAAVAGVGATALFDRGHAGAARATVGTLPDPGANHAPSGSATSAGSGSQATAGIPSEPGKQPAAGKSPNTGKSPNAGKSPEPPKTAVKPIPPLPTPQILLHPPPPREIHDIVAPIRHSGG